MIKRDRLLIVLEMRVDILEGDIIDIYKEGEKEEKEEGRRNSYLKLHNMCIYTCIRQYSITYV